MESRLRDALQTKAAEITPDPALYATVQQRLRRRRAVVWGAGAATAGVAVALAGLTLPAVLDTSRVELLPAPAATQPAEPAAPTTQPQVFGAPADGLVFTDGTASYVMALDGESATQVGASQAQAVADVDVHPASTLDDVAAVMAVACGRVQWDTYRADVQGGEGGLLAEDGACASSVAFSPDGRHVAWIDEDPGGPWMLHTLDWTAGRPGDDDAGFGVEFEAAGRVHDLTVQDWFWLERSDGTAEGWLVLAGRAGDRHRVYHLPIQRQGDGALAVAGAAVPLAAQRPWWTVANNGGYSVQVQYGAPDSAEPVAARLVTDDALRSAIPLPAEFVEEITRDPSRVWVDGLGPTVVFGDGAGAAWRAQRNGQGQLGELFDVQATVIAGALVRGDSGDGRAAPSQGAATADPTQPAAAGDAEAAQRR